MERMSLAVKLLRGADDIGGQLSASEPQPDEYHVEVAVDRRQIVGVGDDYFDALVDARRQLEKEGLLICVAGSRKDVWPSAMTRSMGGGLKAYRMTLGQQARTADLVDIFAQSDEPARITEQEAYRDAWFESLGIPGRPGDAI